MMAAGRDGMRRPTYPWLAGALAAAAIVIGNLGPATAAREVQVERIPGAVDASPPELDAVPGGEGGPALDEPATDPVPDDLGPPADAAAAEPLPPVEYDPSTLPTPVRRLREQLIEAARTGDVEKLRPILDANPVPPVLSFGDPSDPIAFMREQSGDGEGRETLAILQEVLEAGFVHVDIGTDQEMYVWPYFARYPAEGLTGPQMVELFHLITAGDYEDMRAFGAYIFYRVGITPDGSWAYFVAGD